MSSFSLSSYTIRIKDKISRSNIRINKMKGGADVFNTFRDYLNNRKSKSSHNVTAQTLLRVSRLISNTADRTLKGKIDTGEYGYESDLYDVDTESVSYKRKRKDAAMLPFYFLISLPSAANVDEGIILLQRFRQFGIRKLLLEDFKKYFATQHPNYQVEFNPLTYDHLIHEYLDGGEIKQIRLVKFGMPDNIASAFDMEDHVEDEAYVELVVRSRRNQVIRMKDKIRKAITGKKSLTKADLNKLVELPEFDYNTIKADLEINGKRKVIDLTNPYRIRSYYDITDDVEVDPISGHPTFKSIDDIAAEFLVKLEDSLRRNK